MMDVIRLGSIERENREEGWFVCPFNAIRQKACILADFCTS